METTSYDCLRMLDSKHNIQRRYVQILNVLNGGYCLGLHCNCSEKYH